jgi:hypothetical protein
MVNLHGRFESLSQGEVMFMGNDKSESRKTRRISELMLRSSANCENHVCVRDCSFDGEPCEYVWVRHYKGGREVCSHPWIGKCEEFCPRYAEWKKRMDEEDECVMDEIDRIRRGESP